MLPHLAAFVVPPDDYAGAPPPPPPPNPVEPGSQIHIRLAKSSDIPYLQRCNRASLPENYEDSFYLLHLERWPELCLVAEHVPASQLYSEGEACVIDDLDTTYEPKIVAYVLGRVEEKPYGKQKPPPYFDKEQRRILSRYHQGKGGMRPRETVGHVSSLAVLDNYRRRGLASSLMEQVHFHLEECYRYGVPAISLNVRESNKAAIKLYEKADYCIHEILKTYYQTGPPEDGCHMRKLLKPASLATQQRRPWEDESKQECRLPRPLPMPEDFFVESSEKRQIIDCIEETYEDTSASKKRARQKIQK